MKRSIVLVMPHCLLAALTFSGCDKEDPADAATCNSRGVSTTGENISIPMCWMNSRKRPAFPVVYDEFETNEIMYPKVEAGAVVYDVICPSDYMVQKMIENDLLEPNWITTKSQIFPTSIRII